MSSPSNMYCKSNSAPASTPPSSSSSSMATSSSNTNVVACKRPSLSSQQAHQQDLQIELNVWANSSSGGGSDRQENGELDQHRRPVTVPR